MDGLHEGQKIWVEQEDGSQRPGIFVGEAEATWFGGSPGAYVVYPRRARARRSRSCGSCRATRASSSGHRRGALVGGIRKVYSAFGRSRVGCRWMCGCWGRSRRSSRGGPSELGPRKQRAVLAMLALEPGRTVSADRLSKGCGESSRRRRRRRCVQVLRVAAARAARRATAADRDARARLRAPADRRRRRRGALRAAAARREGRSRARRSRCGAGRRWTTSPTSRSRRPRSAGSTSCGCGRARPRSTASWPPGATSRCSASSTSWSRAHPLRERLHAQHMLALYRCGRQSEALAAFRDARARAARPDRASSRGASCAAATTRSSRQDPALDGPPRRAAPRRRRLAARAAAAARGRGRRRARRGRSRSASSALCGPDRLPGIAEDAVGLIDPASGHISTQYPVGHAPDALAAGGGSVWIANGRDGTVSRIDRGQAR